MRAWQVLFLLPLVFLGGCYYSGVVQVSGTIYLSDGVTPFSSARGQLEANVMLDGEGQVVRSEDFVADPKGGYSTAFFFNSETDKDLKGVQMRMGGYVGILIEDELIIYSENFRTLVRSTIKEVCVMTYTSRWYQVPVGNINANVTQDIIVDVSPVQLTALRACQDKVLADYLTGNR